jgi:hypothetical protein
VAEALIGETPSDPGDVTRQHDVLGYECHFLLVAMCNARAYSQALLEATGDARIQDALAAFDETAPAAKAMRNYVTHLDEYLRGQGRDRSISHDAWLQTAIVSPPTEVTVIFGQNVIRDHRGQSQPQWLRVRARIAVEMGTCLRSRPRSGVDVGRIACGIDTPKPCIWIHRDMLCSGAYAQFVLDSVWST